MGLNLIPALNKIDLPSAEPERALAQMKTHFELDPANAVLVSAKTGLNVDLILPAVIEQAPPYAPLPSIPLFFLTPPRPQGSLDAPLKMLLVDSWFDTFKGVVLLVRLFDGTLRAGDHITSFATGKKYQIGEVGLMHPLETTCSVLKAGMIGYCYPGMKRTNEAKIGDTFTTVGQEKIVQPLPGFEEPKPMVFVGAFPVDQSEFTRLDDSIKQLVTNDRSVTLQKEASEALGQGWRMGFLGTLHASVFEDRLRSEHGGSLIITAPTVPYKIAYADGREVIISNPAEFPTSESDSKFAYKRLEPYVLANIIVPEEYLGKVIELCEGNRGVQIDITFWTATQVILKYRLPLAQLVADFFGKLKGVSKGYATLDYEEAGYEVSDIVKLQLMVNKESVDAISQVVHRSQVQRLGRLWVTKFKEFVKRELFEVVIQASVGKMIVARETVRPVRKDVTAKLYGGDVTRRQKLLENQKAGRKRLQMFGKVNLDQRSFQGFLSK